MTKAVHWSTLVSPGIPLDPGNPIDLIPGGGAFVALVVIGVIASIGIGIWRMTLVNSASKSMGLSDEQRLLAVTDELGGTAIVAGAVMNPSRSAEADAADLSTRLSSLKAALDDGLVSPEEYDRLRQRILDDA
jgi:hypothetical protein